jgi:hypothetical protein
MLRQRQRQQQQQRHRRPGVRRLSLLSPPLRLMPRRQGREGIRGNFWFMEAELRNGAALRPDKTGKGLLMVLRHLGRLSEVRGRGGEAGVGRGAGRTPGAVGPAAEEARGSGLREDARAD